MGIDELMARLDRILREQGLGGTARQQAGVLHDALVDLKVAEKDLSAALARTEQELAQERTQLADAERRGKLAQDINDTETAEIAGQFIDKHRARVGLLERKLGVQQDELAVVRQEYETLSERYRAARQGMPSGQAPPPGVAPDQDAELLRSRLDRQAVESAADAQLEMLKKKLRKT